MHDQQLGVPDRLLHPKWRDMSDWVVHFTGTENNLQSILAEGVVRPSGPFGNGRNVTEVRARHLSACFSEIPLDHLGRLYERRGRWGVGFPKRVIDEAGGARVWYLEKGVGPEPALFRMHGDCLRAQDFEHPFWSLSPFIDVMSDDYQYRFDWEREWRVPGGLEFEMADVAFLLVPDDETSIRVVDQLARAVPTFLAIGPAGLAGAPEQLGDEADHLIAVLAEQFLDPVEVLYWDGEDESGYFWPVQRWATEDAVDEVFGGLDDDARNRLIRELDAISHLWVRRSDWDALGA
jgi:hypothetical protein